MAYCPQCRAEYRGGVERCADCEVALVEVLPPAPEPRPPAAELLATRNQELLVAVTSALAAAGIPHWILDAEASRFWALTVRVLVPADRLAEAQALLAAADSAGDELPPELAGDP